jgi:hypothetical protein
MEEDQDEERDSLVAFGRYDPHRTSSIMITFPSRKYTLVKSDAMDMNQKPHRQRNNTMCHEHDG